MRDGSTSSHSPPATRPALVTSCSCCCAAPLHPLASKITERYIAVQRSPRPGHPTPQPLHQMTLPHPPIAAPDDYKDEKRRMTAAMLRRLEVEEWDKERMKHFYYGA